MSRDAASRPAVSRLLRRPAQASRLVVRLGWVLALVVVTTTAAGCGSDDASTGNDTTSTTTQTTGPETTNSSGDSAAVVAVSLRRSGGLKPGKSQVVFNADSPPPPGYTAADARTVLRTAQKLVNADVVLEPVPDDQCCDRVLSQVTVSFADGSSASYQTLDGLQQPRIFERLLTALA